MGVMDVTDVGSKKWLGGVSSFTVIAPPSTSQSDFQRSGSSIIYSRSAW